MTTEVTAAAMYWSSRPQRPEPGAESYAMRWAAIAEGWTPPSPSELRGLLKAMGISQQAAGRMTGYAARTARTWCSGARPVPYAAWFVLRETWVWS